MNHTPVLLNEVIAAIAPAPGMRVVDATFGAGGYTRAITARGAEVLGIDQDPHVIANAEVPNGAQLAHGKFGDLANIAQVKNFTPVDGVVFDIGVSSMQLDQAERGFSFMHDGPLDMRMSQAGQSAADVVNSFREEDIANIIYQYGEEPQSRKIARYITRAREEVRIETTAQLAEIVARAVRGKPGQHPATRTFQALRIYVNDELAQLQAGLEAATSILKPGGKLVVVTFHSLEDRIVKEFFAAASGAQESISRHMPAPV
ncbi:MAG TPA: 16S rRNA (cytosine(1402)-N(4))-methyltransferase RsmH, partial [Alphaproteobacteria bacterium]|nr:16S rRNA (cytosine(1402)-N(4))-methyltransferase RsmH [Alphaproteobacteria bacterium]